MFSAILFAIAIVALAQFALYYWRAVLTGVASQPISERVLEAANVKASALRGADFEKLLSLLTLTPQLRGKANKLGFIRLYYRFTSAIAQFFGSLSPAISLWSERERVLCARYAAVQIGRRLESNLEQVASLHSC